MYRVQRNDAASELQEQAAEWRELLNMAKSELSSICRDARNERESTAQQLERMFESAQRSSKPILGAQLPRRNLGEDVAHVSGGLSASKVCDVTTSLIWKLEESLTFKIGFIGGVFHSWRCEVALCRKGGEMEHQKEMFMAQREKIMRQWYEGDAKGLLAMTMREWKKYTNQAKSSSRQKEQVRMLCAKWMIGNQKALITMGFKSWNELAIAERQRRQIEAALAQEKAARDAAMEEKIREWEKHNANAKKNLHLVFAKWEKGKSKGALLASFQGWQQLATTQKAAEKRKAQMKEMMYQWFEGQAKGLLRSCFQAWSAHTRANSTIRDERRKLEEMMNGELAKRELEAAERLSAEEKKKAAAKESVMLMVRKWEMGDKKGVLSEVFAVWSKYAMKAVQVLTSKTDAQVALAKFLEGDTKGILRTCILHWKAEMQEVRAVRAKEAALEEQQRQFEKFMDDKHAEWHQSAEEAKQEAAQKSIQVLVAKWLAGDKKGLLMTALSSWQEFVKKQIAADQQHESVKLAISKWVEGDKRALFHTCFTQWHKVAQREAMDRVANELSNTVKILESRLELHISHAKTRLLKYFAKLADGSAMLEIILAQWHKFSMGEKSAETQRQLELELQEQARVSKLKEAEGKELILSALANLGFNSPKSILMKHFFGWVQVYEQARIEKEQKMKKNEALKSLSVFMESKTATASRKDLLTISFKEWVHEMHRSHLEAHLSEIETHQSVTMKLEQERAHLVEQLSLVYQQLDQIMETLQKELKTKEELAMELRVANEQLRKAQLQGTPSGGCFIDVQSVIKNSRATSRTNSPERNEGSIIRQQDLDNSFANYRQGLGTAGQKKSSLNSRSVSSPAFSTNFSGSTKSAMESPVRYTGARVQTPDSSRGRNPAKKVATPRSPDSPRSCDWDGAILRMRDEGRFRAGEAPRI